MSIKIISVILGLILIGLSGCQDLKQEIEARKLLDKCKTLKIGMSRDEVVKVMGRPIDTHQFQEEGMPKERWTFDSPRLASEFTQCVIDTKSGLVEEIICGEGYRLKANAT